MDYCMKYADLLEWVQRRASKRIIRLEHLSYEERMREVRFFSLQKRRLWQNIQGSAFQYIKEAYKKAEEEHLTQSVMKG